MGIEYMGVKGMTYGNSNPEVVEFEGLDFMPALNDACQNSTVYDRATDKPLATLIRRSALDFGTDGTKLREWNLRPSYRGLARGVHSIVKGR
jgi:hypothetical protein